LTHGAEGLCGPGVRARANEPEATGVARGYGGSAPRTGGPRVRRERERSRRGRAAGPVWSGMAETVLRRRGNHPSRPAGSPEDLPANGRNVTDFGPGRAGNAPGRSQDRRGSETSGEDRASAKSRPSVKPPRRPRVRQSAARPRSGFTPASRSASRRADEAARLTGVCPAATPGASALVGEQPRSTAVIQRARPQGRRTRRELRFARGEEAERSRGERLARPTWLAGAPAASAAASEASQGRPRRPLVR
jgi:hypothetical protein